MQQNSLAQQTFVISYTRKTFAHKGKNKFLQRKTRVYCSAYQKGSSSASARRTLNTYSTPPGQDTFLAATKLRCGHEGVHLWMWLPCLQKCNYLFFAGLMQNITTTNTIDSVSELEIFLIAWWKIIRIIKNFYYNLLIQYRSLLLWLYLFIFILS